MSDRPCSNPIVWTSTRGKVLGKANREGDIDAVRVSDSETPILLCIDECQDLQLRKSELERLGFAVRMATSGSAALAALKEGNIHAVLLVYRLGPLDVEATAFEIKMDFPNLPILLLAQPEMPDRILWLVDDYLLRSEPLDRIIDVLSRLAQCKRQSHHSPAEQQSR